MTDATDPATFDPDLLRHREDGLALLTNDAMRARRRPLAIAWVYAAESVAALLVAWPIAALVRGAYGSDPRGDAPLWDPGALALSDLLVHLAPARGAIVVELVLSTLLAAVLGLLPLGALLASIAYVTRDRRAPPTGLAFARAAAAFPSFAAMLVAATSVQIVLLGIAAALVAGLSSGLADRLGEARADQLAVLAALVVAAVAALVGVVHDLARAAAIRFRVRALRAAILGANTLRRSPVSLAFSWAWRAVASLVPIGVGALVAERVGGRGGGALFALFVVHQLVVASRVALRASWMAKALRAVDHAHRVVRVERR